MLIAGASLLGLAGFTVIIRYESWLNTLVVIVLAVATVVAIARTRTSSRWIPTASGAIAALMFLVWGYALRADGSHHALPTPGAVADLITAITSGQAYADASVIPVVATPGFAALVAVSVTAVFLVAEHLAVSWGLTATAGLVLLLAWLPAAILQHRVSITLLVLAIACWVMAMVLTRPSSGRQTQPSAARTALSTAAVVGVAVLVAPLAVGAPGWGDIPRFSQPAALDGTTRLNLALDLRNSLTASSQNTVMVYASSGRKLDTLRLYSLTEFDGNSWEQDTTRDQPVAANEGVLWPGPVSDWEGRTRDRIDIQVRSLSEKNLPLPSTPRTVDVGPGWEYYPSQDEVTSQPFTTKDLTYSVVTDLNYHHESALVAAQSQIDSGADEEVDPRYLTIAPAIDAERMRQLASDVTDGAASRYAQGIALQNYLRDPATFRYDTTVPPTGEDSVSEFLDAQAGYCVQFATAMVVLARSLDIPARMAVGFLGGEATPDDTYVVRGSDAHAWPELYFADQGWVRFEPTPAVQTGAAPTYADASTAVADASAALAQTQAPVVPRDAVDPVPDTQAVATPDGERATNDISWWAGAAFAFIAIAISTVIWWRRRRHPKHIFTEPERAWGVLHDRLTPVISWPDNLTPHEAPAFVEDALNALGLSASDEATVALERISRAVSAERYLEPTGRPETPAGLIGDAQLISDEVKRAIKKGHSPRATTKN